MAKFKPSRNTKQIVILVLLAWIGIGVGVFFWQHPLILGHNIQGYADRAYALCSTKPYPPSCYDEEIPKFMNQISMEDAFAVTRLIQTKDPRYLYCHVLAHKLSYQETGKDLSKWKDVITRCPTTMCNNGCQHGAIMRRFNQETLTPAQITQIKPDLMDVCEPRGTWHPTEVERSMCYHALGHLAMYVTKAEINQSVALCGQIGVKPDGRNYVQTCTEGTLMTVYQPLEPEDFALIKGIAPKKEQVTGFCNQFSGEAFDACHRESWPLFTTEISNPEGLTKFCGYSSDELAQRKCYGATINILTINLVVNQNNQVDPLAKFCQGLTPAWRAECFADAARRMVQIDPQYLPVANSICIYADKQGFGDLCYKDLGQMGRESFQPASEGIITYCQTFPTERRAACLKK